MICRAAFAGIVKFSSKVDALEGLKNQVDMAAGESPDKEGAALLTFIISKLKEDNSAEFEALAKTWETASQMRKWTS